MRRHSVRLGICLVALAALSHPADQPIKEVGVLLGLRGPSGLRTLWIQSRGPTLVLSRELPSVVVPHRSRLCRLLLTTANTDAGFSHKATFTHSGISVDCGKGRPKGRPDDSEGCEGSTSIKLLFVSSTHVSLDVNVDSACYGRTSSYDTFMVVPIRHFVDRWLFRPFSLGLPLDSLGQTRGALKDPAVQACKSSDEELRGMLLTLLELDSCSEILPTQWGIRRSPGRWTIVGRTVGTRTIQIDYDAPGRLPSGIYSWAQEALSPTAVLEQVKDAQDFVTSPGGAFALLLRPDVIQAARVQDGLLVLGDVLGNKHPEEAIVSIEWATGSNVPRWAVLIDELAATAGKRARPTPKPEARTDGR